MPSSTLPHQLYTLLLPLRSFQAFDGLMVFLAPVVHPTLTTGSDPTLLILHCLLATQVFCLPLFPTLGQ